MPILTEFRGEFEEPDEVPRPVVAYGGVLSEGSVELDFHRHGKAQIMFALRGVLTCEAEGGMWIVPPGRALWVPGETLHRVTIVGPTEGYNAFFAANAVPELPEGCCTLLVSSLLRELLIRAANLPLRYPPEGREARLMGLLIDEIGLAPVEKLHLPMPKDARLRRIFGWMMAEPAAPGTVEHWAGRVALSGRTLARLVRRETGMSFGQWRQQLQLNLAIQRMAAGASVQAVAFELGYESAGSFVTMFRKALGAPPAKFMERQRR